MTDDQVRAVQAAIDVWCCACGQEFPGTTELHNGLCTDCVREGKKRPWEILAENERMREAIGIALLALEGYLRGESGLPFSDHYRAVRTAAEALCNAR